MELKFYRCSHCGQIIVKVKDTDLPVSCCGDEMQELVPNTSDGATEKHVPVCTLQGNKLIVIVGSDDHPMLEKHYIQFIAVQTRNGVKIEYLKPGDEPKAVFKLCDGDEVESVFEYCNLHGLWKV